jgi:hypothetical protein
MKSLEPSHERSLEQRSKAQPLYRFHAYRLDDPAALRRLKLCDTRELEEGDENHTGLLHYMELEKTRDLERGHPERRDLCIHWGEPPSIFIGGGRGSRLREGVPFTWHTGQGGGVSLQLQSSPPSLSNKLKEAPPLIGPLGP